MRQGPIMIAVLGALASCGPLPERGQSIAFEKPGQIASGTELRRDWGLCNGGFTQNGQMLYNGPQDSVTRCMIGKGWVLNQNRSRPANTYWYNHAAKRFAGPGQHIACGAQPKPDGGSTLASIDTAPYEACMRRAGFRPIYRR